MTLVRHDGLRRQDTSRYSDVFDRWLDEWPELLRRPVVLWGDRGVDPIRVEEFNEGETRVIRAELAGIDPDKDVELSVEDDVLHIHAERREEETTKERDYVRREVRYGSFHRDVPLPRGTTVDDVKASYKDGMLEIKIPMPKNEMQRSSKIPVTKG